MSIKWGPTLMMVGSSQLTKDLISRGTVFCCIDTKLETTWLNRISPAVAVASTTILAKYIICG